MVYLVYRTHLLPEARADLPAFWAWLGAREKWFYRDFASVKSVRRYSTVVGPSYTVETWLAFESMSGYAEYVRQVGEHRQDPEWERRRVEQDRYWEFLDSRLLADAPVAAR
jgi:hypothetical protein